MSPNQFEVAARTRRIAPFHVMELVKQARQMEAQGASIIHMNIGEPDFRAAQPVIDAMASALAKGHSGYTPALGIMPLRQAIASHYEKRHKVTVNPERIMVTAGGSAALLLTMAALVDPGSEVLMPDPSYPCNRHFVSAFDGVARLLPSSAEERFQLSLDRVAHAWGPSTRGLLVASPSNPTGTSIDFEELRRLSRFAHERGGFTVVDEIYQELSYGPAARSAVELQDADTALVVINSFSKYFCMTGWRLGWLVVPEFLIPTFEKLAQNLYICASAPSQYAALACFSDESLAVYEERKAEFKRRRDYLVPALSSLGFKIPVVPDGAFYIYADVSGFNQTSDAFCQWALTEAGVSIVPGHDFGEAEPDRWVRISYATSRQELEQAVERLRAALTRRSA